MKGVSQIISYVMIVTIVLTSTMIAYAWALPLSEQLGERGKVNNFKNQMIGLDYVIRSAAHGDVNFTNEYEMQMQDAALLLNEENDVVYLVFQQRSAILGKTDETGTVDCDAATEYLLDNSTRLNLFRDSNFTRVFGGSGGGPGVAEFAVCYYDVNLSWGGV
ncbi:hypothetical protein H0N95_02890, partial [Candidatus Micrarchaeota archaeon]|nr:hypothetical protein [Candidatus Micrarchaeota archaeon]